MQTVKEGQDRQLRVSLVDHVSFRAADLQSPPRLLWVKNTIYCKASCFHRWIDQANWMVCTMSGSTFDANTNTNLGMLSTCSARASNILSPQQAQQFR